MPCTYLCPGNFSVWVNTTDVLLGLGATDRTNYLKVPAVLSWSLEPSTDEPTTFRTADTSGSKVAPNCSLATEWELTVTTKLCIDNWLYTYVLAPAAAPNPQDSLSARWFSGSKTQPAWWYVSWDQDEITNENPDPPVIRLSGVSPFAASPKVTDQGIYFLGTPTPPAVSGDNDSDDTASGEFTVKISDGPWFPDTT